MSNNSTPPASSFFNLRETIDRVVLECLDPPTGTAISVTNLQNSYDALMGVSSVVFPPNGQDFIQRVLLPDYMDWLEERHDFYRALIVNSFLLLLLLFPTGDSRQEKKEGVGRQTLMDTIENSILLLKLLANCDTEHEFRERLLPSRYHVVNALLEEPLLPLSPQQRCEFWNYPDDHNNNHDDDGEEQDDGENNNNNNPQNDNDPRTTQDEIMVPIPTKKELIEEERQLLKMANTEIPDADQQDEMTAEEQGQSRLYLQNDVLKEGNVRLHGSDTQIILKLFRCGVLLVGSDHRDTVSSTTLIQNNTDNGAFIITLQRNNSTNNNKVFRFCLENLQEGFEWIEALMIAKKEAQLFVKNVNTARKQWK